MSVFVLAIVVTGIILLVYHLAKRGDRAIKTEALQDEVRKRSGDACHRFSVESPLLLTERDAWLMWQTEADPKPMENVTSSLTHATDQSRCPACGAIITSIDERCPACEISFVTDGTSFITDAVQKATSRTVGPVDGIYRPPTEFRE